MSLLAGLKFFSVLGIIGGVTGSLASANWWKTKSNIQATLSVPYLVIKNLGDNSGKKLIITGSKIFEPQNKETWMDWTGLNFYLVDKDFQQEYFFEGKDSADIKAWIRTNGTKASGWCFKDKSQCGTNPVWELKDLMFKFVFEGPQHDFWWNMYINKCRSEYESVASEKEQQCFRDPKSFVIEKVEFKKKNN